jgi:hypothetical protein
MLTATTRLGLARRLHRVGLAALVAAMVLVPCLAVQAQIPTNGLVGGNGAGGGQLNLVAPYRSVGGISINAAGLLENASLDMLGELGRVRAQAIGKAPADLREVVPMRKISLRGLDAAIADCFKNNKPLTDDLLYLGGLQQVRYIFVYPEQHDIVLVGPAEGWKVDAKGDIVGLTTNRPVMLLDDLLVAIRAEKNAATDDISCSIGPTAEGLQRWKAVSSRQRTMGNPQVVAANFEQALGKQQITFTGVPDTSHFARVLIAADYRMKRIAMNFEKSPVAGLPSFLSMMSASGPMMPRWWLEPKYDAVLRDGDGLAWEFRGGSAKCMTEEDFLTAAGTQHSGKASPLAQKWADLMTAKYPALAVADPTFGKLRNCMELAIVGAVLAKENLVGRSGGTFPMIFDVKALQTDQFAAPKEVDSKVSMIQKGTNWIVSASGGVAIHAWAVADKAQKSDEPAAARAKAAPADKAKWCWN